MKSKLSRRTFISTTGALASTGPLILSRSRGMSPNEMVNHAVIGVGGQGSNHVRRFDSAEGCRVVAVCDPDIERLERASQIPSDKSRVKKYRDHRLLLEDKHIDTVSVVTCDHWHTPVSLAAILAGKHVYVEKPCSHNIHESNLLVKCAQEYGKCVQHGTQRRSSAEDMAGVRALREGLIGEVYASKAINHQLRKKIGIARPEPPPPGVDYDYWLGPAPKVSFTRNRWHYNWHWFWDYAGGDLVNDGIHQVDVAIWGMGVSSQYPERVLTSGGQFWYDDDHETPDTQTVIYEYPGKQIIYEMRLWTDYKLESHDNGTIFYGTKGKLEIGRRGSVAFVDGERIDVKPRDYGIEAEPIIENFLTAFRRNDPSLLNSPIQKGAVSANLCHLGNIGVRCGGIILSYDPATEMIVEASKNKNYANALIRRQYRQGYELPYEG